MGTEELTPAMQELMARMSSMQTELTELKTRASLLPQPHPVKPLTLQPAITTTRRKTLRRLGLALLGGAATAAALGAAPSVNARVIANPAGFSNRVGMFALPPGAPNPTGAFFDGYFGLIGCGDKTTPLNVGLIGTSAGLVGFGSADGTTGVGVQSKGAIGVSTYATTYGVSAYGGKFGILADGGIVGGDFSGGDSGYGVGASAGSGYISGKLSSTNAIGLVTSAGKAVDVNTLFAPNQNVGLYATAGNSGGRNPTAAYFEGTVAVHGGLGVQGNLTKSSGTFKIDHPLDPENKYLYHSFVESPDMKNIYDGVATLDEIGGATVKMPDWFEALNRDFRYQLTCIGQYAPVFIAQKITGLDFKIAGGQPGQEVSWMVTGIRQDEWAKAHPIRVEEDKTGEARGKYLHPEVFGKPDALRVGFQ